MSDASKDDTSASESENEDENIAELDTVEPEPQYPFDDKTTQCVPDLRFLCALPKDSDTDGVDTFRAILLEKGKSLHVLGEPGAYATTGEWRTQLALSYVHFIPETKRKMELLLSFSSFDMLSTMAKGVFVQTLSLPLTKKRNLFEDVPKFTKIGDVAGFTTIDVSKQPWATVLPLALEKQQMYKLPKIFSPSDIIKHGSIKLETRILKLAAATRKAIDVDMAILARQDARAAQKQKQLFEGRFDKCLEWLRSLPPAKYDRRMSERIIVVKDGGEMLDVLTTPERKLLDDGEAVAVTTALRARRGPLEADFDAAAPAAVPTAVPAAAGASKDAGNDTEVFDSDDGSELPDVFETSTAAGKRPRKQPARLADMPPQPQLKKAKPGRIVRATLATHARPMLAQKNRKKIFFSHLLSLPPLAGLD